jgi:hypothetical protein
MATETAELQAGPELDALVAEKVMGWNRGESFRPSTDIAAAWEVVEHMKRTGFCFGCWDTSMNSSMPGYLAAFRRGVYPPDRQGKIGDFRGSAFSEGRIVGAMPLAICRAALAATCAP